MTVYVDWLADYGWKLGRSCHATSDRDDLADLHDLMLRIGMKAAWFQTCPPHSMPHYDLVASRRARAVALGAVEVNTRTEWATLILPIKRRWGKLLVKP